MTAYSHKIDRAALMMTANRTDAHIIAFLERESGRALPLKTWFKILKKAREQFAEDFDDFCERIATERRVMDVTQTAISNGQEVTRIVDPLLL